MGTITENGQKVKEKVSRNGKKVLQDLPSAPKQAIDLFAIARRTQTSGRNVVSKARETEKHNVTGILTPAQIERYIKLKAIIADAEAELKGLTDGAKEKARPLYYNLLRDRYFASMLIVDGKIKITFTSAVKEVLASDANQEKAKTLLGAHFPAYITSRLMFKDGRNMPITPSVLAVRSELYPDPKTVEERAPIVMTPTEQYWQKRCEHFTNEQLAMLDELFVQTVSLGEYK